MEVLAIVVALLFAILGLGCLVLVVIGLPGTWVLIGLAAGMELLSNLTVWHRCSPATALWLTVSLKEPNNIRELLQLSM